MLRFIHDPDPNEVWIQLTELEIEGLRFQSAVADEVQGEDATGHPYPVGSTVIVYFPDEGEILYTAKVLGHYRRDGDPTGIWYYHIQGPEPDWIIPSNMVISPEASFAESQATAFRDWHEVSEMARTGVTGWAR